MKHSTDFKDLAEQVGNLRYDALVEFFGYLSAKMERDAEADLGRGRSKLALCLSNTSIYLDKAKRSIDAAWKICEPHMKEEL